MTGLVLSILIGLNVALFAEFPALSAQAPVLVKLPFDVSADCVPPPPTVFEARSDCTAPASAQAKVTATSRFVHVLGR